MKRKELLILLLLAAVNFTNIVDFMVIMPLAPLFKLAFDMSPSQWSFVVSSYGFAAFVSGILSIFFIDKFDRKTFLLSAYTGFIIATYLCSQAATLSFLITARILTGIFGGLISTIVLTIVGDLIPLQRRARAMGIVWIGFSAAAALGVPLGIYFADKFTWHMPFIAISAFAVLLLIAAFFIVPSLRGHIQEKRQRNVFNNLKLIFTGSNKLMGLIFFSVLVFGHFLVIPFLSPYLVNNVSFTNQDLINLYLIGGLSTIVTSPIVGKLSDKYGRKKTFKYLLLISFIPVYLICTLTSHNVIYALILSSVFFMLVSGRIIPALSMVIATAEPQIRGTFLSIRSSFQQLFSAGAAYVSGVIIIEQADGTYAHYDWIGYLSIGICFLTIFLVGKVKESF